MQGDVTFTRNALEQATEDQIAAINRMNTEESGTVEIAVQRGGLGLPIRYLTFRRDFKDTSVYGGIDVDGSVST